MIENVTGAPRLGNTSVFRPQDQLHITERPAHTLTIGNGSGQAGVILNGGDMSSAAARWLSAAAEGVVYNTFYGNRTITSAITGTGGVTFAGNCQLTAYLNLGGAQHLHGRRDLQRPNVTPPPTTYFGANSNVVTFNGARWATPCRRRGPFRRPRPCGLARGRVSVRHLAFNISGPGDVTGMGRGTNGSFIYLSGNNSYTGGTFINGNGGTASSRSLPTPTLAAPPRPSALRWQQTAILAIMGNGMTNLDTHPRSCSKAVGRPWL